MSDFSDLENKLKRSNIWLCGSDFDEPLLESFMEFYASALDNNILDAFIYISSDGGYVSIANAILSIIEASAITFHTISIGQSNSCGLLLAAGGDLRYATKRARFLYHDLSLGAEGHPDEIEDEILESKKMAKSLHTRFAKKTNFNLSWWNDQARKNPTKDFKFGALEAKKYGVIDYIGIPEIISDEKPEKKRIKIRKHR